MIAVDRFEVYQPFNQGVGYEQLSRWKRDVCVCRVAAFACDSCRATFWGLHDWPSCPWPHHCHLELAPLPSGAVGFSARCVYEDCPVKLWRPL